MIEINLIPDVKRELLKAQRMRRVAISISMLVGVGAVVVVVILGVILGAQTIHENIAKNNIKTEYNKLKAVENIDDVLTIQNQLSKIQAYQDKKSMDSRLFDIINAINPPAPNNVRFSSVRIDPATSTISLEGVAPGGYGASETMRKSILNTKVESGTGDAVVSVSLTDAVSVTQSSFGQSADGAQGVQFTMSFVYPSGMLDNTLKSVKIVTPTAKVDVTDSRTRVPDSLFTDKTTTTTGGK